MDMLGHDDVSDDGEPITVSHLFQNLKQKVAVFGFDKSGWRSRQLQVMKCSAPVW